MTIASARQSDNLQQKSVTLSEEIVPQIEQWAEEHDADFDLALEVLAWCGLMEDSEWLLELVESEQGFRALTHVHECAEKTSPERRRCPGY